MLSVDYEDDLIDTLIKIFNTINELLKVFNKDEVKINLYLENLYLDNGDSIDMTIVEFIEWVCEELKVCDSIDMIEFAKWVREELDRYEKVAIKRGVEQIWYERVLQGEIGTLELQRELGLNKDTFFRYIREYKKERKL